MTIELLAAQRATTLLKQATAETATPSPSGGMRHAGRLSHGTLRWRVDVTSRDLMADGMTALERVGDRPFGVGLHDIRPAATPPLRFDQIQRLTGFEAA
jgi:hypothetical protein